MCRNQSLWNEVTDSQTLDHQQPPNHFNIAMLRMANLESHPTIAIPEIIVTPPDEEAERLSRLRMQRLIENRNVPIRVDDSHINEDDLAQYPDMAAENVRRLERIRLVNDLMNTTRSRLLDVRDILQPYLRNNRFAMEGDASDANRAGHSSTSTNGL